ncbi:MAG: hypothetical protein CSB06_03645 [Bacteroidia bacterium]|nr:MAG: hypothetical protein CSB06_03645 [Bacteroidia bacterium]
MKRVLLILCVLYQQFSYAQQVTVQGDLKDVIDEKPIPNAQIKLYLYNIKSESSNLSLMQNPKEECLYAETRSDSNGKFFFPLQDGVLGKYLSLKIIAENYETQYYTSLTELAQIFDPLSLTLTPTRISAEQRRILEQKNWDERMNQLAAKAADLPNILAIEKDWDDAEKNINKSGKSCQFEVPELVYVKNLHDGYNGTGSSSGYTGYINFDLYVGGVVQGEIGGLTSNIETKKAQAVAARTFSLNRHLKNLPVNIGQAYKLSVSQSSKKAGTLTSKQVLLYGGKPIDAKYAARCNGDYTQNADEGTWNPRKTCKTSGTHHPYLVSVPCAGHKNCYGLGENPCCKVKVSTTGKDGYIYGHGVGLCQRGIIKFGNEKKWTHCKMLTHYYTGVCITNASECPENTDPTPTEKLDCSKAVLLEAGKPYDGLSSAESSAVTTYACNNWTETGPERVHRIIPDKKGTLRVEISNFTGDLDVYILGSCNPTDCLGEVSSSGAVYRNAQAGKTYYIVVDSDNGSGSSYTLLANIESPSAISEIPLSQTEITIYPNPATNKIHLQTPKDIQLHYISVYDLTGRLLMKEEVPSDNKIDISQLPKGVFFLHSTDSKNQNYTTKLIKQ